MAIFCKADKADEPTLQPLPPPLDPQTEPPLDRFCDLVLKGGVVDGVVYPGVLVELARGYRFQSLAGTSVGAIAAAITAACEYARRFGSNRGFDEVLRKIPKELAEDAQGQPGRTVIRSLFQTVPALRRLFDLVVDVLAAPRGTLAKDSLKAVAKHYGCVLARSFLAGVLSVPLVVLASQLLAFAHQMSAVIFISDLPALSPITADSLVLFAGKSLGVGLLAALLGFIGALISDYLHLTGQPGFGFCSGLSNDGGQSEGLIEWLHRGIQGAAGLTLARPLTFADLWDAPCGPKNANGTPEPKSIDLRMMTTCVSHSRPYELPLVDASTRLFFKLSEWQHYFPPAILEHLKAISPRYTDTSVDFYPGGTKLNGSRWPDMQNSPHPLLNACEREDLRELPAGNLPVLVAVRLSMNFPILFQAVPLWAIDHERGRIDQGAPMFKKAWFADGGITANFPLHIFDNPIPAWPTFGIFLDEASRKEKSPGQLETEHSGEKLKKSLSKFHTTGRSEKWTSIREPTVQGRSSNGPGFVDYLMALFGTAKDWANNANLRMPGVRDRVVVVYKNGMTGGGLNLKILPESISKLAYDHGTAAGQELAKKFMPDAVPFNPNLQGSAAWLDHRWVRFNSYLTALKTQVQGLTQAAHAAQGTSSLSQQIDAAQYQAPLYYDQLFEPRLTPLQATALHNALASLQTLEAALCTNPVVQPYVAKPQYELKARSRT